MSLSITGDDFNAPTNPQLISGSSDFSDGDRVYTAIVSHGAVSVAITGFGGTVTENSNLANTKGFKIKCYDSLTTTGVRFNPADWNATTGKFTTNDYFVLLYSDSPLQHHLAKITEVKADDLQGDAFEFEPRLGKEIPKDTKFIIFQVTQNTDIVAISLGMKQDDSLGDSTHFQGQLARRMVVARPLFYFYDGLDKEGELDHNTKYFAMRECGTANSYTLAKTDPSRAFVTVQDFGKTVIDYSKYSHRVKLFDTLRELDDNDVTSANSNEGVNYTKDETDYDKIYLNTRRIADDETNSPVYTGPIRYLHYDFSPTKSNVMYNVYDHVNTESIDGKGGFAETSILDNGRIVPKKIKEFSSYRVRHNIHRADFDAFFPLKATYSSSTSAFVFSFNTEYDLETVLNAGDEVKLGDKILIVNAFGTHSGTTHTITFQNDTSNPYARGENDGVFTAQSITPSSNEVLHRRAYNATDGTLMLDTHLLNGRFSKMYVAFTSLNHKERFATVTACDAVKNMITLSFTGDSYNSNSLSFTKGQYQLFIERFNGEIENIETKKEEGQSIVEIKGRDKFNKLLSPIINLNTLFSEDIIYSSNSPYNKLGNIKSGNTYIVALGATEIETNIDADPDDFDNYPVAGTRLFGVNGYVGEVLALSFHNTVKRKLVITPAITELNSEALYMEIEKNYVLSKSLGSSHLATNKPTSLTGAASKGLIFTSGNKIKAIKISAVTGSSSTTVTVSDTSNLIVGMEVKGHAFIPTGTTIVSIDSATTITISAASTSAFTQDTLFFGGEGDSLVATSANTNEGAIGYAINSPSSILNDFAFQAKLKDEQGSAGESSFDTVNTLIDFEIVSIEKKENESTITLAPYLPITLGRKLTNYANSSSYTLTEEATIQNTAIVGSKSYNDLLPALVEVSTDGIKDFDYGDAVFIGSDSSSAQFAGYVSDFIFISGQATFGPILGLDRNVSATTGHKVFSVIKDTHDLFFINGKHLWGSKILTIPHPKITSRGAVPINFENIYSNDIISNATCDTNHTSGLSDGSSTNIRHITMDSTSSLVIGMRVKGEGIPVNATVAAINNSTCFTLSADTTATNTNTTLKFSGSDIAKKYGQMYYKLISMSDGNFNLLNAKTNYFSDALNKTYENKSKLKHHAVSYKFSPNIVSDNTNRYDKTGTGNDIQMDLDMRGIDSTYGSNFSLGQKLRLQKSSILNQFPQSNTGAGLTTIQELSSDLDQKDTSAATLFFYINSDVLPYSSLRKDSIMNSNKIISNYNLFLMENNKAVNEELGYTDTTSGKVKNLKDNSFQEIIFHSDKDITSLKRFGIMRLTELCFDVHFNPINPEKPTVDSKNHVRINDFNTYLFTDTTNTINVSSSLSASSNQIVLDTVGTTPTNGQTYYDSDYRKIGEVDSYNSGTKTITFTSATRRNIENTFTSGSLFVQTSGLGLIDVNLKGTKSSDSFITKDRAHIQRGSLVTENYATHSSDFWAQNADNHSVVYSGHSDDRVVLPLRFHHFIPNDLTANLGRTFPSRVFRLLYEAPDQFMNNCKAVVLDTYSIEQGEEVKVEIGLAIPSTGTRIEQFDDGVDSHTDFFILKNSQKTFGREYPQDTGTTGLVASGSSKYEASGANLCFCARLHYIASDHDTATTVSSSNGTLHSVGLNAFTDIISNATCDTNHTSGLSDGSSTSVRHITMDSTASLTVGMSIRGVGIPVNAKVAAINNSTCFTLSADPTETNTNTTLRFSKYSHGWLDFLDLTGCYLVSEVGYDTDLKTASTDGGSDATNMRRMDNVIPEDIIYVVSHEINNDGSVKHNLTTDKALTNNRSYRIMKPNETAFYEKSPNKISLNMLSPNYTKKANSDEMYSPAQDYAIKTGSREKVDTGLGPIQEAILSMYVAVDLDKQSSSEDYIVMRKATNFTDILSEGNHSLYMTDGENSQSTSITVEENSDFTSEKQIILTIGDIKEMHGIVSISETFSVTSNNDIKITPTRACIGATISIGVEGEDLINELFEQEEITYQTTTTDTPLYLAPNYQGVDLYSAIRYILQRKEMKLVEENDVFRITPKASSDYYTNITINDSGDYLISEFEKETTLFDFYNEIIVYGISHKAVRRDIRSINKRGRKTLEVLDSTLLTQEEVDKHAIKLLIIHSRFNQKISITMQNKGINQLRVGDIVSVAIPRENIEMSEYIVLEMQHLLTGFIKLQLGRYTKNLEDIFSELLISNKSTKAALRSNNLLSNEISYNLIDTLNTKELKLLIRKREASGGLTLGFGTALGFTAQFGFEGGASITITNLVEEDLT